MDKFDHDLNTFFALIFHEISLSGMLFKLFLLKRIYSVQMLHVPILQII